MKLLLIIIIIIILQKAKNEGSVSLIFKGSQMVDTWNTALMFSEPHGSRVRK